ncbi:MAG: GPR endopeptidase [Clostridia bacterium]
MDNSKITLCNELLLESAQFPNLPTRIYNQKGLQINETEITPPLSRKHNLKAGSYINILPSEKSKQATIISVIGLNLQKLVRKCGVESGKILVVGLGNKDYIVDALGNMTTSKIKIGGQTFEKCALSPQVSSITGISSFNIISGVIWRAKPSLIIAIDTLATQKLSRLGVCYQLTTGGICPGGGVNNPQPALDKNSLGVPVIAIGVPLIISIGAIFENADLPNNFGQYMVTPRDVDFLCDNASSIIASAINEYLI